MVARTSLIARRVDAVIGQHRAPLERAGGLMRKFVKQFAWPLAYLGVLLIASGVFVTVTESEPTPFILGAAAAGFIVDMAGQLLGK
jgi:hypothetical protein